MIIIRLLCLPLLLPVIIIYMIIRFIVWIIKLFPKYKVTVICSAAATAIGVIAVFFPDLFNMNKSSIHSFEITLSDRDSAQELEKVPRREYKQDCRADCSLQAESCVRPGAMGQIQ